MVRRVLSLHLILILLAASGTAHAQDEPIVTHEAVKGAVYWVEGGTGLNANAGVILGRDGVIVVNAKGNAASAGMVTAEIAKLTTKPITHIILTHSDGQNGLIGYPGGVTIIAHENSRREMAETGGRGALPQDRLPNSLIAMNQESRTIDGVKVQFRYFGPSHTTGDLAVYFPDSGTLFTGNIITTEYADPFVHPEKGGSSEGWLRTVAGMIAMNAKTYVPGHGPAQTLNDMKKRLAGAEAKRQQVIALIKEGKSLDQIREILHDEKPAIFRDRGTWVEVVDHEVAGR